MAANIEIIIGNMVCRHCVAAVAGALSDMGFHTAEVRLGKAEINAEELTPDKYAEIDRRLNALGFVRIQDPNTAIVERAKLAVIDHVRNETECRKNLSACMEEHLDMSYDVISRQYSAKEGRTIEKYHIAQKIERVKELLDFGNLTLGEIAFRTGYSSTAHLSRQFKNATGMTPTEYQRLNKSGRIEIDKV